MRIIFLTAASLMFCAVSVAQSYFNRTYGTTFNDSGEKILKLTDSTFFLVGASNGDFYVLKVKQNGDTIFTKSYGSSYFEHVQDASLTAQNELILIAGIGVTGSARSIIKLDVNADTVWTRVATDSADYPISLLVLTDGSFFTAGYKPDSLIIVGDDTLHYTGIALTRYDSSGNLVWQRTYGNPVDIDFAYDVVLTEDSSLLVVGSTYVSPYGTQFYLFKADLNGDTIWTRTLYESSAMVGQKVLETSNGDILTLGAKYVSGEQHNININRFNSSGIKLSGYDVDFNHAYEGGSDIIRSESGGYYALSSISDSMPFSEPDIVLMRLNEIGDTLWTRRFVINGYESGRSIVEINPNAFAILGIQFFDQFTLPQAQVYLIICDSLGNFINTLSVAEVLHKTGITLNPNPATFAEVVTISTTGSPIVNCRVVDVCGRTVYSVSNVNSNSIRMQLKCPAGLYFLEVTMRTEERQVQKLVVN